MTGAGVSCCNGTYARGDPDAARPWVKEDGSGEFFKPVYDSDWGWVLSDADACYHYFSDPDGRVDRVVPPGSDTATWGAWNAEARKGAIATVTIVQPSGR